MSFRAFKKQLQPGLECEPLSPDEADVLLQARAELGDDFGGLPRDQVGFRGDAPWFRGDAPGRGASLALALAPNPRPHTNPSTLTLART
jgi:hypothetical protein